MAVKERASDGRGKRVATGVLVKPAKNGEKSNTP